MIVFLTSAAHTYTHDAVVEQASGLEVRTVPYEGFQGRWKAAGATYVFTDMDRLPVTSLVQAARLYRSLRDAGARVLNDPARLRSRWGLLRALYQNGLNGANAYRLEEGVRPQRYPVFLGIEGEHQFPSSDLLYGWDEVERAVEYLLVHGAPRSSIVVVEYQAEPVRPGIFRKLSVFRVGNRLMGHTCVHQDRWIAKYGTPGLATPELYEDELRLVAHNPHGEHLRRVFELACVDYGRADFGLVGGRVHVYEINTNPHVKFSRDDAPAQRVQAFRIFRHNYFEALRVLDGGG